MTVDLGDEKDCIWSESVNAREVSWWRCVPAVGWDTSRMGIEDSQLQRRWTYRLNATLELYIIRCMKAPPVVLSASFPHRTVHLLSLLTSHYTHYCTLQIYHCCKVILHSDIVQMILK